MIQDPGRVLPADTFHAVLARLATPALGAARAACRAWHQAVDDTVGRRLAGMCLPRPLWPGDAASRGACLRAMDRAVAQLNAGACVATDLPGPEAPVYRVAFAPDGRAISVGDADGHVRCVPLGARPWAATYVVGHAQVVEHLAYGGGGAFLASGARGHKVYLQSLLPAAGAPGAGSWWLAHPGCVTCLAASATRPLLASAATDGHVRIWDLHAPHQAALVLPRHRCGAVAARFGVDGTSVATAGGDGVIALHALGGQAAPRLLRAEGQRVSELAFAPDGTLLLSGGSDRVARVWDPRCPAPCVAALVGHQDWITGAIFAPGPPHVATSACRNDGVVRLWDLRRAAQPQQALVQGAGVSALRLTPSGRHLLAAAVDGRLRAWRLPAIHPHDPRVLAVHDQRIHDLAVAPDGTALATAGWDGIARHLHLG